MLSRRNFILSAAAAPWASPRAAHAYVGAMTTGRMMETASGLTAIATGHGGPTIHIIVSPGCDHALRMWDATKERQSSAKYRWIPYATTPASTDLAARLLELGDADSLQKALSGAGLGGRGGALAHQAMERQNQRVDDVVAALAYAATARPFATPTSLYTTATGPVCVRGSVSPAQLDDMLAYAL